MTNAAAIAPRTKLRRIVRVGVLVIALVVVVLAVTRLLVAPFAPWQLVAWELQGYGGPAVDPTIAQTTAVVPVFVRAWPVELPGDAWLGTPAITYTPWSVTITLHTSDAYQSLAGNTRGWYDTGGWVQVHLNEPLGGRLLFDGSQLLPVPRSYP